MVENNRFNITSSSFCEFDVSWREGDSSFETSVFCLFTDVLLGVDTVSGLLERI